MELAYRIAVDESPFVKAIRENAITLITPILEVDGRDKQVDVAMAKRKDPKANVPNRLLYWGKYVSHDNNRDNLGLALKLSQHVMKVFFDFHPLVMHDLHESISFLYISTGTGPYNAWLDPITVDEWNLLAYREVNEMTKEGVPGVWTHGFYDGWAPNYAFYAANGHNAIGRFYETQGAGDGSTQVIGASADRAWFKPNPPLKSALWSIRNNVNLQQSGVLIGMNHVATAKDKFLENFYLKSKRSVAKARAEGPAAYVFPGDDPRPGQQARLLRQLQAQGVEVHKADKPFKVKDAEYPAGSYVVRMDQPYSRMADMMLDRQYFNVNDPAPYDDVGWTLGPLYNVKTVRIEEAVVLDAPMTLVKGEVAAPGGVARLAKGTVQAYLINHNADNVLATFRFAHKELKILAAEKDFEAQGRKFRAGSFLLKPGDNPKDLEKALDEAGKKYGFAVTAAAAVPDVPTHEVGAPRIAVVHTWQNTQNEGWLRIALDESGIPYHYVSVHAIRDNAKLRDKYDVIIFGPSSPDPMSIINGVSGDKPQPWKKTPVTPNIGVRGLDRRHARRDRPRRRPAPARFRPRRRRLHHHRQHLGPAHPLRAGPGPVDQGHDQAVGPRRRLPGHARRPDEPARLRLRRQARHLLQPVAGLRHGRQRRPGPGPEAPAAPAGRVSGRGGANDPDVAQGRPRDLGQKTVEEFRKAQEAEAKKKKEEAEGEEAASRPRRRPSGRGSSSASPAAPRTCSSAAAWRAGRSWPARRLWPTSPSARVTSSSSVSTRPGAARRRAPTSSFSTPC